MNKVNFSVVFFLLLALFGWLIKPVVITMDAPSEVIAGVPFEVDVAIKKRSVEGFARFQQKLPKGFSAELIDAETADFRFENQTVKFFWLILPKKDELFLKYRITTDVNISGKYSIDGIFSYIDGDKKYAEMSLHNIEVKPSPLADQKASSSDTGVVKLPPQSEIICERQNATLNDAGEILIELKINRGDLDQEQFAKIQEFIPEGYDAKSVETLGGIFTFENRVAKFLWMTLPKEPEFVVSYKLIPKSDAEIENLKIKGNFSYLENGQTIEVDMKEVSDKPLSQIIQEQIAYQKDTKESKATTSDDKHLKKEDAKLTETHQSSEDKVLEPDEKERVVDVPQPDSQVHYRVQISAGHKRIKTIPYFAKRKIREPVTVELLDGWFKYTIGSFPEYLQARDKRNDVWKKTPINDAFVTAYNSGQRITVQEALMITHQTWEQ